MPKSLAYSQVSDILPHPSSKHLGRQLKTESNKSRHNDNSSSVFISVMSQLSARMSLFSFRGFIEPLTLSPLSSATHLVCVAPTEFHANWVKDHYLIEMKTVASKISSKDVQIEIIYQDKAPLNTMKHKTMVGPKAANDMQHSILAEQRSMESEYKQTLGSYPYTGSHPTQEPEVFSFKDQWQQKQQRQKKVVQRGTPTDQKFSFESFIDLPKQRMALLACKSVAQNPGQQFNPLILSGDAGLGKSHLLQAIAKQARIHNPNIKVVYITAEQWVNEYIRDIRNQQFDQFRNRYRNNVDLLLIDDLQFFAGKDASQEELLHTIESLEQHGKQVVLSANQYPYEINGLKQKLQNRLASGLIVDLLNFDESDRQIFIEEKAKKASIILPTGVSEFLATHLKESVRQLEGALLRLSAYQNMSPEKLNFETAKTLFKPLIQEGPELSMEHILQVVLGYFDIRKSEVMSKSRQKRIVQARQLSMFFIRKHLDHSLPEIGRFFNRKHSTVLASVRKINKNLKVDASTQAIVARLGKAIL